MSSASGAHPRTDVTVLRWDRSSIGGNAMTTQQEPHAHPHVPAPDEPTVPELEEDENVAPRPEEEIADVLRAEPDVQDHTRSSD